jgi:LmbE family N-acetylglucosaminyl deacetylase
MTTFHRARVPDRGEGIASLLGIWAHPDDEAYLSSGLMSLVADAGGRVAVVTATRGEHGTDDPEAWPPERLGPVREQELRASLDEVGVQEHHWLSYRDGELAGVPLDRGAAELVPVIEQVRPEVIVTFGPEGMTGHPDHRTVSAWTTEAWRRTGCRAELWYATLTPEFHRTWGELNDRVGLWTTPPPVTAQSELAAHLQMSGPVLARKHRALRAHASQTRALEELVGATTYRRWWSAESFVAPAVGDV